MAFTNKTATHSYEEINYQPTHVRSITNQPSVGMNYRPTLHTLYALKTSCSLGNMSFPKFEMLALLHQLEKKMQLLNCSNLSTAEK